VKLPHTQRGISLVSSDDWNQCLAEQKKKRVTPGPVSPSLALTQGEFYNVFIRIILAIVAFTTLTQAQARDFLNRSHSKPSPSPSATASPTPLTGTYSTNFLLAENPISENSNWINGGVIGLDWTNVRTMPGQAMGTMPGNASGDAVYADSTAVLAGAWGPTQTAQGTIFVTTHAAPGVFEEVELRLRITITAHSITGYEINCSVNPKNLYVQIVRWNGPINNWTLLDATGVKNVSNGSILRATISGNTITAYLNGTQVLQVTDGTYTNGSPGIGFFLQGATGVNANYGFSSFTATASP
jgi:hypothetical protein